MTRTNPFGRFLFLPSPSEGERRGANIHFYVMIKSELIAKIAKQNPHLYQRDIERIVNTFFDSISDALARGERVELRGFGAFAVKQRAARVGRNPKTGEAVQVEAKFTPHFKTGKELREKLNGK